MSKSIHRKALVHLHVYYHDQVDYFIEKLKNINGIDWDLVVTMADHDEDTERRLKEFKADVRFLTTENFGYDVWPFLKVIKNHNLSDYDYVIKLHTKRSMKGIKLNKTTLKGFQWRNVLVDGILHSPKYFRKLLDEFEKNPQIGMISSLMTYLKGDWNLSGTEVKKEMERLGLPFYEGNVCYGTMFMARASVFLPLQTDKVDISLFDKEKPVSGLTFSTAHYYERLLSILPDGVGLRHMARWPLKKDKIRIALTKAVMTPLNWIFAIEKKGKPRRKFIRIFGMEFFIEPPKKPIIIDDADNSGKPVISVIVPVYKVEKYLPNTLDSIFWQNFKNWECILVDDGSPDNCGEICEDFARKDSRFKVIHKENGGLSSARNAGLKIARGDYIAFIDSDDWVEPDYLGKLLQLIKREKADVAQCGFYKEYEGFTHKKPLVKEEKSLSELETARELLEDSSVPNYMWNKLFRKEVISAPFPEGKLFEDIHALTSWIKGIHKIALTPTLLYHYRMRKGSIMNSNYAASQFDYFNACLLRADAIHSLYPEHFDDEKRREFIFRCAIIGAKSIARKEKNLEARRDTIARISSVLQSLELPSKEALGLKKWNRAKLLRDNPLRFEKLLKGSYLLDFHSKYRMKHLYD